MADDPQIKAIVRGLERLAERVIIKITLDVTANLIETTPVDTGWARANWVPAIGSKFEADLSKVKATVAGATAAAATQQGAIAAVAVGYKLAMGRVFISNNVPYINRLNDGWSNQAPKAFVQRAIVKAITRDIKGLAT